MALPTINARPEKTINSIVSRWNAVNLPLQYTIGNDKWPLNSVDAIDTITAVNDKNGYAQIILASTYETYVAKEWVEISSTSAYNGVHRVRAVDGGNSVTIDFPYSATDTGTCQRYYQNYTSLIRVYAGLAPQHEFTSSKPIELIGTIEQKPDSDNLTKADVREYVKDKLEMTYDSSQSSWPNDLNAFTDFYISVAERYDSVSNGEVIDFTSAFTNDNDSGDIIYLKAVHSALQLGNDYGGNMYEYVIFADDPYYDGSAKFMTLFDRPKIIDYIPADISIIIDTDTYNNQFDFVIEEYNINGVLLATMSFSIEDSDYGVYRLPIVNNSFDDDTKYINVYVDDGT